MIGRRFYDDRLTEKQVNELFVVSDKGDSYEFDVWYMNSRYSYFSIINSVPFHIS